MEGGRTGQGGRAREKRGARRTFPHTETASLFAASTFRVARDDARVCARAKGTGRSHLFDQGKGMGSAHKGGRVCVNNGGRRLPREKPPSPALCRATPLSRPPLLLSARDHLERAFRLACANCARAVSILRASDDARTRRGAPSVVGGGWAQGRHGAARAAALTALGVARADSAIPLLLCGILKELTVSGLGAGEGAGRKRRRTEGDEEDDDDEEVEDGEGGSKGDWRVRAASVLRQYLRAIGELEQDGAQAGLASASPAGLLCREWARRCL